MVVAITAALAVGGTMAYLTDTDDDVNVMTIGNVKIQQIEQERVDPETSGPDAALQDFQNDKPLYPAVPEPGFQWDTNGIDFWDPSKINNEQDKIVSVKNTGDYDAFVRTVFAFEAGGYTWEQFQEKLHLNINKNDWSWEWIQEPVIIGDSAFFRNDGYPRYLLNTSGSGTQMIVRGGTFVDHHPGKSNDANAIHVPEGYQVVSEKQENGETFYTVVPVS